MTGLPASPFPDTAASGAKAKVRVKEAEARITLTLPTVCDEEESVQAVLAGMMLYLCNLRDEYPENLEVLEV